MEAMNQKNINSIEQNFNSLESFAEQGLEKLKELKGYNNDPSLIVACRSMLNFYKDEAKKGASLTDFYLSEEGFAKLKKQFDSKPGSKRTQQDIDQFNKAVNDINSAANKFNALNNQLNKERETYLNGWNNAVKKYLDNHVPMQRR